MHYKEKIKVDKNGCEYILFRISLYFTEYFLAVKIDEENHESRELIFEKKRQETLEKKLVCKFIAMNTSDARTGYDTDYEVQTFFSKFKDEKIKELENEIKEFKIQLTS